MIPKERYLAWTVSVTASGLRRSKRPAAKKDTEWEEHTSRYVGFRLVYDRGTVTKLGLKKQRARVRVDSILIQLARDDTVGVHERALDGHEEQGGEAVGSVADASCVGLGGMG